MSRLALLVPARNATAFLPRLFASVRRQTAPFDEVLVYDDASQDGTGPMAEEFGARVVRRERQTGPSVGKNALARETACEWVHFHDADETLEPEFVTRAREWIARDDRDVVVFATEDREEGSGRVLGGHAWDAAALAEDSVRYTIAETITNCGIYRRRSFLEAGGFDEDPAVAYNEDQAMHVRLALKGLRFGADPYRGVIVYRRSDSMSGAHPIECARAQVEVLGRVVGRTGQRYAEAAGPRLWRLAGVCAGYSDWRYVRRCLELARSLAYRDPRAEHWLIRLAARVHPFWAVAGRERVIRLFKPHLRAAMPSAAGGAGHGSEAPSA